MNARQPISASNYLGAFGRIADALPGQNLGWLHQARERAIERFACIGFPSQRDEDWKYTSVAAIENTRFSVLPPPCADFLIVQVAAHALPDAHVLVFVNGCLEPGLCRTGRLPPGMTLSGIGYMLNQYPGRLEDTLLVRDSSSIFSDLNLAFMTDGAYVRLPPGATVKAPIQLLFITTEGNLAVQPRNLVLAAAGSSATIVEHHVAARETGYFTNTVTNIVLGPGASIEHHKLQQESPGAFHIAAVNVAQEAKSRFTSTSFALGARLARTGITVRLQAEGASCSLDGLYLTDGRQHIDHHTRIDHLKPGCSSRELYKGVLNDASRAVFNGRVVVHPDAQGSDAFQSNHNLLLSEDAEIDTKPQLEIWADNVKCSHGATIGQLDEDHLFYLRSRGLEASEARRMLVRGFLQGQVDRLRNDELRADIGARVLARIADMEIA